MWPNELALCFYLPVLLKVHYFTQMSKMKGCRSLNIEPSSQIENNSFYFVHKEIFTALASKVCTLNTTAGLQKVK